MSSSSATVRVEKATSDLLIGPDWTINIEICDNINSHHWHAKDILKALKKRLLHKNPKVQILALTLLETMVKNCGEFVHFQIVEKNILHEMTKIVKKKADMQVRDKILSLLDSWKEAFGGPAGKYSQYYWAYEELRRSGIEFPRRSSDTAPIFTPPVTQAANRMPTKSSRRLDEAMAFDKESLSLSSLESMRNAMTLLSDMLQAVHPNDRAAVKDEVIVDLVDSCRLNQKKLMQMLLSTGDEQLLASGLELNDDLQSLLVKYDAISSGVSLPAQTKSSICQPSGSASTTKSAAEVVGSKIPKPNAGIIAPVAAPPRNRLDHEDEEDDFALLARRHSRLQSGHSPSQSTGTTISPNISSPSPSSAPAASTLLPSNALALPDPPAPVKTSREQDMIDLLSLSLVPTSASNHTTEMPQTSSTPSQNLNQVPPIIQRQPHLSSQAYPGSQVYVQFNSYVAPWALPQPQNQCPPPLHAQLHPPQLQYHHQNSSDYSSPPRGAAPNFSDSQSCASASSMFWTPQTNSTAPFSPLQGVRPFLQHANSLPARGSNEAGNSMVALSPRIPVPTAGQRPFVPSYRLFEDLNILGRADGKLNMTSTGRSPSMAGDPGQGYVGARK